MESRNCIYESSYVRKYYRYYLYLLLVCALCAPTAVNSQKDNLTLAVFISGITLNGTGGFTGNLDGRVFQAAVELAVDIINEEESNLLPGYHLNHVFNDSRVSGEGPFMCLMLVTTDFPVSYVSISVALNMMLKLSVYVHVLKEEC